MRVEFRCRLASATGEIVEGVYVADSEARLRHELEEKGLYVLALQPKGAVAGLSIRLPQRAARVRRANSSSSTRNWRRCSRPACRSCSRSTCCKRRVESPTFKRVLDDVHERVRVGLGALGRVRRARRSFPSVYTASLLAGERSGSLDAVLRRFVEYTKIIATRQAQDRVRARVPGDPHRARARSWSASSSSRWCRRSRISTQSFGAELPLVTRIIVARLRLPPGAVPADPARRSSAAVGGVRRLDPPAGAEGALRSRCFCACRCSATSPRSSPRRRWRGRWRRCSAAACRS